MTDKEIEKALEQFITTGRCVGDYRNCKGCPLEHISVCNYRVSDLFARYKDRIRKDTAKEIFRKLKIVVIGTKKDIGIDGIKVIVRDFGVEVDK